MSETASPGLKPLPPEVVARYVAGATCLYGIMFFVIGLSNGCGVLDAAIKTAVLVVSLPIGWGVFLLFTFTPPVFARPAAMDVWGWGGPLFFWRFGYFAFPLVNPRLTYSGVFLRALAMYACVALFLGPVCRTINKWLFAPLGRAFGGRWRQYIVEANRPKGPTLAAPGDRKAASYERRGRP